METRLVNLFSELVINNFLTFIDVQTFLQNTCQPSILENLEVFFQVYKGNPKGKRGYVWVDCANVRDAFESVFSRGFFMYKLKMKSFDADCEEENLLLLHKIVKNAGFTSFMETGFVVFFVDQNHFNVYTASQFKEFCEKYPLKCYLCCKIVKNERALKRHFKVYHSVQRVKVEAEI